MGKLTREQHARNERWIKALRSGDYQQGTGRLKGHGERFCCLGVACQLLIDEGEMMGWSHLDLKYRGYRYSIAPPSRLMTPLMGWVSGFGPKIRVADSASLIDANDSGVPFVKIADAIEHWLSEQVIEG